MIYAPREGSGDSVPANQHETGCIVGDSVYGVKHVRMSHSADLVEVWHGRETPAIACGFCARYYLGEVYLAHNAQLAGRAAFDAMTNEEFKARPDSLAKQDYIASVYRAANRRATA